MIIKHNSYYCLVTLGQPLCSKRQSMQIGLVSHYCQEYCWRMDTFRKSFLYRFNWYILFHFISFRFNSLFVLLYFFPYKKYWKKPTKKKSFPNNKKNPRNHTQKPLEATNPMHRYNSNFIVRYDHILTSFHISSTYNFYIYIINLLFKILSYQFLFSPKLFLNPWTKSIVIQRTMM